MSSRIAQESAPRPLGARPSERALALLWQNAHVLSEGVVTEDGRRFRVVYPGRANTAAGPDFRDCVIIDEEGQRITGDVELHLKAGGWAAHGHDVDPNYNGVVLHVVLHTDGHDASQQQSRARTPVASIAPSIEALGHRAANERDPTALAASLRGAPIGELLDAAGDQRFHARAEGFKIEMRSSGAEEALYGALMEGMGYATNRKGFRDLSKAVPFASLSDMRGEPDATRLLAIQTILVNAAGLIEHVGPPDLRRQLELLAGHLPPKRRMSASQWRLFRVRPANHPARRLLGAGILAHRHIDAGLIQGMAALVRRESPRLLTQGLEARPYIGTARARDIAVSVILPFVHGWAQEKRDRDLAGLSRAVYRSFPSLGDNEITREMKRLIATTGDIPSIRGARRQQGLAQLYRAMTKGQMSFHEDGGIRGRS